MVTTVLFMGLSLMKFSYLTDHPEIATHTVMAVLTHIIASNEKGHQLPVILKIHSLKGENHDEMESSAHEGEYYYHILYSQCQFSWCQLNAGPELGFPYVKSESAQNLYSKNQLKEIHSYSRYFSSRYCKVETRLFLSL